VVLELRDRPRTRLGAVVELPRAPAGLQGSRTSGALGPDTVVMTRRIGASTRMSRCPSCSRSDAPTGRRCGSWTLQRSAACCRRPLADDPALRLEVANVDAARALVVAFPDVAPDALLPLPTFGPLGDLKDPHLRVGHDRDRRARRAGPRCRARSVSGRT
jgi:hypothetical protein